MVSSELTQKTHTIYELFSIYLVRGFTYRVARRGNVPLFFFCLGVWGCLAISYLSPYMTKWYDYYFIRHHSIFSMGPTDWEKDDNTSATAEPSPTPSVLAYAERLHDLYRPKSEAERAGATVIDSMKDYDALDYGTAYRFPWDTTSYVKLKGLDKVHREWIAELVRMAGNTTGPHTGSCTPHTSAPK